MSKYRQCLCCSTFYEYCGHCNNSSKYPTWMSEFDNVVCKNVFNIISAYNMGLKSKDDVKRVLDDNNVTDFTIFKESIRNKLNELFPVVEQTKSEDEISISTDKVIPDEEPIVPKKRNRRNRSMDIVLNDNE